MTGDSEVSLDIRSVVNSVRASKVLSPTMKRSRLAMQGPEQLPAGDKDDTLKNEDYEVTDSVRQTELREMPMASQKQISNLRVKNLTTH